MEYPLPLQCDSALSRLEGLRLSVAGGSLPYHGTLGPFYFVFKTYLGSFLR